MRGEGVDEGREEGEEGPVKWRPPSPRSPVRGGGDGPLGTASPFPLRALPVKADGNGEETSNVREERGDRRDFRLPPSLRRAEEEVDRDLREEEEEEVEDNTSTAAMGVEGTVGVGVGAGVRLGAKVTGKVEVGKGERDEEERRGDDC